MSTQTTALILSNIDTIAYFAAHNRQPENHPPTKNRLA